ncbi:MAG: chromosome segregation protein SMC [Acidimicrobiales bacterium]|nr:chromosome segregation protein SMC [Acidimicrobiales bacterium]
MRKRGELYLKSLTLKGFKSFADSTTLELEPGVTVVVGPNGSGKSNVVDAIAWVLGAQAPSAVRSQKMEDVIFAGTTKRSALGRAEVGLVIDNTSGQLPIEFNEVTITRTLFRTGESEYALNGVPCRLLDIQELLSDSGVGRQQHVIISQGQIDAVLNAKPEDRRAIIEEAAGILKYRKRKEKSERRLQATEANLTRLQDLLREVRRQLRPLERQAEAARRHGDLVAELTALRIHVAGRELHALKSRLESTTQKRAELAQAEAELNKLLAGLDAQVMSTEARLSALGGDDLGDTLAVYESLYEKARGLVSLLGERHRGLERERDAFVDQAVVASLEAEAASLASQLAEVEAEAAALEPDAAALVAAEAELAAERERFEAEWADGVTAPSGQAAEVRGELAALRSAVEQGEAEIARVRGRIASLEDKERRLADEADRLRRELSAAEEAELPLVESLDSVEQRRNDAASAVAAADAALRAAESEHQRWMARAEALALALDEVRARAGVERLAEIDGVLGTLLDLAEVDEGWELAFEAAAGEALSAVIVDGEHAARRAIELLHLQEETGAVLALGAAPAPTSVPPVGEPVRRHVKARRPGVDALLDALVGGAVAVSGGWVAAVDAALAHPRATIVTHTGDRFTASGWRIGSGGSGATGAALEEARRQVADAAASVEVARRRLKEARHGLEDAERMARELSRKLDDNDGLLAAAGDALQRVETDRRDAQTEAEALRTLHGELLERVERERSRVAELEAQLPALEAADAETLERGRTMSEARNRLAERAAEVGARRTDLEVRTASVNERGQFLRKRLAEVESRLAQHATEREHAGRRRLELESKLVAVKRLAVYTQDRLSETEAVLGELRERRRKQSEAVRAVTNELDALRRERHARERELSEVRELLQRAEVEDAETRLRLETAVEALRRDLDCEPTAAMEAPCPPLAEGVTPNGRIRELERELRIMGPINPLALQEFEELQQRHQFLQQQLDDVKESRRELHKIIRAIDEEIVNVFAAAFADVSHNFEQLFQTLFPGGSGRLCLTEPDNLLETGIEVEAKPSGKNVKKLSLLSGGERSLTALAFLFAVFRSRPSPFYVMDEVEAALDDVNLHRFLGLVDEFRKEAQLIIVSHQKRTMEAADCLYGVSMQPGGSSKVVSEKVEPRR